MKRSLLALFPLIFLAALASWASGSGSAPGPLLSLGRLAGILAAAGVLAQMLLVSRAKWLEPLYGLDRLTRAHHVLGLAVPLALILHPVLVTLHHSAQTGLPFLGQYKELLGRDGVLFACSGALFILGAVTVSLPPARALLSYEAWHGFHLLIYAGLGLSIGHQLMQGGDLAGGGLFAAAWCALYAFALANLAWGRLLKPLLLYRRHRFAVETIMPETTGTDSIWVTGRGLDALGAEAGQFALLRFWAPGFRSQAHPFSFSKAPDGKRLRFTIKKVGDFTERVHHSLTPGTPVILDGPYGVFTEKKCLGDKALLVAGGIGITPVRALLERLQAAGKHSVLLYANRSQRDVVFRREVADMEARGGLAVHHVLSGDRDWEGETGRVDAALIKRLVPDFAERDAFLCGPPPMTAAVAAALRGLGVPAKRIHSELFSL